MIQHLINHVSLVVDRSGSMTGQPVVKVFDAALDRLKSRSVELNQETRISIYLFDDAVECLTFDMDVMRFKSLKDYWKLGGSTDMVGAVYKSIVDHEQLQQMYGDHAFLQYVLTDGAHNHNGRVSQATLKSKIAELPDNWTLACLVPDASCSHNAKLYGIPKDAISIWSTASSTGLEEVGKQFSRAMDNYMTMRSTGVRGTSSLFTLDTSGLKPTAVKRALEEVHPSEYEIFPVRYHVKKFAEDKGTPIKEFVEAVTDAPYRLGSAYYQPTKKVKIQNYKGILIQDCANGRVYEGDAARQMLGLPDFTVEVDPGNHKSLRVFVQSTSTNRKLFKDTFLLVRR